MYWEDRQLDTNEPVAGKAVGAGQYLHLCTATADQTPVSAVYSYTSTWQYSSARV